MLSPEARLPGATTAADSARARSAYRDAAFSERAEAGSASDLPSVNVYTSSALGGSYLAVTDGFSTAATFFGLLDMGSNLQVRIRRAPSGWYYWVVVVY